MAQAYKVLDQSKIAAADTFEDGYTVPSSTEAVVSNIVITNIGTSASAEYSIKIVPSGETSGDQHYIVKDATLAPNSSESLTWGLTLAASDKFSIAADNTDVVIAVFGTEIS